MRTTILFMAAALLTPSAHGKALAQSGDTAEVDVRDEGNDDDQGNSKLGLLGLLGLAGLLGLKRRDPDIHIDARAKRD